MIRLGNLTVNSNIVNAIDDVIIEDSNNPIANKAVYGLKTEFSDKVGEIDFALNEIIDGDEQSKHDSKVNRIVCWGDSITSEGSSCWIPELVSKINSKGYSVSGVNCGVGSNRSWHVAWRSGGITSKVKPFTIPAAANVPAIIEFEKWGSYLDIPDSLTGELLYNNFNASSSQFNPCYISGVKGNITCDKTTKQISFSRTDSGDEVQLTHGEEVFTSGSIELNKKTDVSIIFAGTNDSYGSPFDKIQETIDFNRLIAENCISGKYIIIGLEANSRNKLQQAIYQEAKAFGKHFLNIFEYMQNYGLQEYYSLGGTFPLEQSSGTVTEEQCLNDINNGYIPSCLYRDTVHTHFNRYGQLVLSELIYRKGKELGYWK